MIKHAIVLFRAKTRQLKKKFLYIFIVNVIGSVCIRSLFDKVYAENRGFSFVL